MYKSGEKLKIQDYAEEDQSTLTASIPDSR